MTLTDCQRFFTQPATARQRQYEALRAYFLDKQPSAEVARRFGYLKGSFLVPLAASLQASGLKLTAEVANGHVRRWLDEVANERVHATTKAIPARRLAEERSVMLPAPALKTTAALPIRVPVPVESLQHPLAVYDALLEAQP